MAINILDKLKEFNVEVTADMEKAFKGEFISVDEHNKKVKRVEDERDNLQKNYDQAKATLDGFEGKDLAQIEKDRDEWKEKAENTEKEYKQALEKRDYADLIEKATAELKFTSNSAKKAFKAELMENPLPVKDGKLLGFDDFVKVYEEGDKGAFVTNDDETQAQFTTPNSRGNAPKSDDAKTAALRAAMGLPPEKKE